MEEWKPSSVGIIDLGRHRAALRSGEIAPMALYRQRVAADFKDFELMPVNKGVPR